MTAPDQVLICGNIAKIPGSKRFMCAGDGCFAVCFVSPASFDLLDKGVVPMCGECTMIQVAKEKLNGHLIPKFIITKKTIQEFMDFKKKEE